MVISKVTMRGKHLEPVDYIQAWQPPDFASILRHIRTSRAKLGAVLECLEHVEPNQQALEQLSEISDSLADEAERLAATVRTLFGKEG